MKHIYLLLFMLIPMTGMAQEGISQDTTLYVNGRKILIKENEGKIKVKLYERTNYRTPHGIHRPLRQKKEPLSVRPAYCRILYGIHTAL